jgi:FtsZ-binding cell division protein ZapB
MDVFVALEDRVEKLIAAYKELQVRVATLEGENTKLRVGGQATAELTSRISELESERDEVRARLEKLLKSLSALDI